MSNQMNMSVTKRIFVLLTVLFLSTSIAFAEDNPDENDSNAEFTERDNALINNSLNYLGYDSADRVYRTDFIEVKEQDSMVSLIYDDEQLIGEYIKLETADDTYESFIIENCDALYELLTEEKPMVDNEIVNLPSSEAITIEDIEIEEAASTTDVEASYKGISQAAASYLVNTASEGGIVLVENVSNITSPDNNKKLCWAACGASVVRYYRDINIDTLGVYNAVKHITGTVPVGTASTIQKMFDIFLIGYQYRSGKVAYSGVINILSDGSPIFCGIRAGAFTGHAVLLCGAFKMYDTYGYVYMDPDIDGKYVLNYMDYDIINTTSTSYKYYAGGVNVFTKCEFVLYHFKY